MKQIAESYTHRIWNEKDLSAIDDLIHKDAVAHSPLGNFHGQEAMKKIARTWLMGFPDLVVKNIATICEGDLVVIQWQAEGSHQGEFKGINPTGKQVSYAGVTIYRIKEGKIVEYWAYTDMQHLLEQLRK
jgi:steroid delta-isomerase-like uncharacterized protein